MDSFIATSNIKHFKTLLLTETDEPKRRILVDLLAIEEEKLALAIKEATKLR